MQNIFVRLKPLKFRTLSTIGVVLYLHQNAHNNP